MSELLSVDDLELEPHLTFPSSRGKKNPRDRSVQQFGGVIEFVVDLKSIQAKILIPSGHLLY